jgi:hypothetical protein
MSDRAGLHKNSSNIIANVMNLKIVGELKSCIYMVWYMTHYCTQEKENFFLKQRQNPSNIKLITNHKADPRGWACGCVSATACLLG